ncbi:sporulation protein [Geobacillus thermocatenulatus]|uniref:sporulation protein n=1 Tax=Geobacillus thermocatenulatus TaxID=33938 RepID=UPI00047438F2|nr:sporulation protein [Geobacillus thermocatenulatus]
MLFKKLLSSIGIGSATVDTKLVKAKYVQGETVEGVVEVRGGSVEQHIDEIYLALVTTYIREIDDKKFEEKAVLGRYKVSGPLTIGPNEMKTIPFQFALPYDVPVTLGTSKVWLQTGLDIKMALDPQDRDYLTIEPHPLVAAFLDTARQLGFRLHHVECEQAPRHWQRRLPFVQEFEFRPRSGAFRGRLDELEAIFFVSEHEVETILEIDRKARGLSGLFAEALDMDETFVRFTYGPNDIASLPQRLANLIQRHS